MKKQLLHSRGVQKSSGGSSVVVYGVSDLYHGSPTFAMDMYDLIFWTPTSLKVLARSWYEGDGWDIYIIGEFTSDDVSQFKIYVNDSLVSTRFYYDDKSHAASQEYKDALVNYNLAGAYITDIPVDTSSYNTVTVVDGGGNTIASEQVKLSTTDLGANDYEGTEYLHVANPIPLTSATLKDSNPTVPYDEEADIILVGSPKYCTDTADKFSVSFSNSNLRIGTGIRTTADTPTNEYWIILNLYRSANGACDVTLKRQGVNVITFTVN